MRRAVWRALLRLRFALLQRHRHDRLVLERNLGFPLVVLPGVFNPTLFLTTRVLVDHLVDSPLPAGSTVLDLGTGSGALAVAAARTAARVVAVDVNPEAVRCATINMLLNRVDDRAEARHGTLFEPVLGERFDRVLCNPPFLRGTPRTELERAFCAPDFAERFAADLSRHLTPGGCALVVLSSVGDEEGFVGEFRSAGLVPSLTSETRLPGEEIRIWRISETTDAVPDLP